jgi:hypothetical protein
MLRTYAVATVFAFGACGGANTQVEVKGGDPDLASLAGNWEGNYQGQESGRTGTIKFALELGRHTADGEVFMGGSNTPLQISFVAVQKGQISGKIQPYTDPSCTCQVETEFLGDVVGNIIDGTFTTKVVANGVEQHGTWKVTRAVP